MNRDIEYIAYHGEKFTIEWYFDEKKHSQSQEKALKVMDQYTSRVKRGDYYD